MTIHLHNGDNQDHRRLLQIAAIFGCDFSIDWIIELTGVKASSLLPFLEAETHKGTLLRRDLSTYRFNDADLRDKIVAEIAPDERILLHKKIAGFLLQELPEDDHKPMLLAPHILCCADDVEGCQLLLKVAEGYLSEFHINKALECYYKVIQNTLPMRTREGDELFIEATLQYSKVATTASLNKNVEEVSSFLRQAIDRAQHLDNRISSALLHMHLAKTEWISRRFGIAIEKFETGLAISQEIESGEALRPVHTFIPFFYFFQGLIKKAIDAHEKYAPGVEQYPIGKFSLLSTMTVGLCYVYTGMVSHGLGMLNEIRDLLANNGDDYLKCNVDSAQGEALMTIQKIDDAIVFLKKSLQEANRSNNIYIADFQRLQLAYAYHLKNDNKRSIAYLRDYLKNHHNYQLTLLQSRNLLKLLWQMELGKYPRIKGVSLEEEIRRRIRHKSVFSKGMAYHFRALMQRHQEKGAHRIEASLKASLHCLAKSGHQIEYTNSLFELARHYRQVDGDDRRAKKLVTKAADIILPINPGLIPGDLKPLVNRASLRQDAFDEILKLGNELTTIKNQKDLALKIITSVNRITGAERGAIFMLEDDAQSSREIELKASRNITAEEISNARFNSSTMLIKQVAQSGEGKIVQNDPRNGDANGTDEAICSRICVPMKMRDTVVGVLYHDIRHDCTAFKTSDLKILTFFAAQAAIALSHAASYEKIERLNQKLKEQNFFYKEQQQQMATSHEIIGDSPVMRQLNAQIQQVAQTDATVLILGETGVGKDLVAQTIHRLSNRANKPYIGFQCSAMPESLISSELFGHERGAFTGATSRRIGRFELADGGTLFLDEIGTLPLDIQIHLLRVLQNREFERIGGCVTISSDFRLITATNVDLEEQVEAKHFRADLYYRLNIFPIHVPPLRDRIEDIPLLANHFLKRLGRKRGKFFNKISRPQLNLLMDYDWPGNVRELENVIERGAILIDGPEFELPERIRPVSQHTRDSITLEENERRHILWALRKKNWKVSGPGGTAEMLDIHPSTLLSRMNKLGVKRPAKKRTAARKK